MVAPRRGVYAEEAAEVEVLNANVDKLKSLRKKIGASLARLEESGRTVQEAIGPVYGNTQRLQTMNTNIERIQEVIEKFKAPLEQRDREERILRSRPDRVGLQEYMSSIDRTSLALRNLKTTNIKSNQQAVSDLSGLLQVGIQNLEDVFRDILRQESQPIEPLKQLTTKTEFPRLSSNKSGQLRTVNQHISAHASQGPKPGELTPSARAYAHERGQYVTLSLQNLATASLSTARKVNADAVYKQGSNGIGHYAQGIQGMYTAEYDSISAIFTREEWGPVLQATCQSSLATFASTLGNLDTHVKSNLLTDCYLAYEIVDVVSNTSLQLENRTGELKYAMSDALKPVRETAKSSLATLLNDLRTKLSQMQSLPTDGSTVPITSEVMTRLQLMTSYLPPVCSLLRSLGDGGWSAPSAGASSTSIPTVKSFDVGADGKQLFSHYAADTIEVLLTGLESRAKNLLRGRSLQGVFLANNICVVERMIRNSELDPLLTSAQPKLDAWKRKVSNAYLDAWSEPSKLLLDVQSKNTPRPSSTGTAIDSSAILKSLSSKEKEAIKEKWKTFNTQFDELVAKHKSYRMESEVRRQLGKDVQTFMEPLYTRFWDRYHEVDKGKGKYVKYDKGQMSGTLSSLA
ncbi:hypothetical protein LTR36_004105 [Oleoguttula mirabilis]|uniref:Exocyst complex protein EXO70 n=1 Tax=Oleoguttula mirabilis TaxID=1507867 RepID=A0AAV9JH67_9PEZI|nr:hypothetical protein LTR36_004105 [Oleoguttula mirabilis]